MAAKHFSVLFLVLLSPWHPGLVLGQESDGDSGGAHPVDSSSSARVFETDPFLSDCSTLGPGQDFNCPSSASCAELDLECFTCKCPLRCAYGREVRSILVLLNVYLILTKSIASLRPRPSARFDKMCPVTGRRS